MNENEDVTWRQHLSCNRVKEFLAQTLCPPFDRCPELTAFLMLLFSVVLIYFYRSTGLLISSLLLALLVFYSIFYRQAEAAAGEWFKDLKYAEESAAEKPLWTVANFPDITGQPLDPAKEPLIRRLLEQKQEIEGRAHHHLVVLKYFYAHYYACLTLVTYSSIIAALMLTVISKYGWDNLSNSIITVFLVCSSAALLYGGFIKIYSMDKNIADNKKLYLQYIAIDNRLNTCLFTNGQGCDEGLDLQSFIVLIDKKLEALHNIAVGFDTSNIPDISKMSKELLAKADSLAKPNGAK